MVYQHILVCQVCSSVLAHTNAIDEFGGKRGSMRRDGHFVFLVEETLMRGKLLENARDNKWR